MNSITDNLRIMWGSRAPDVAVEYKSAATHKLLMTDLAIFCNAAAPIAGPTEYDRGVEEGKRRVWLHISRMAGVLPDDFIAIANGDPVFRNPQ